MKTKFLLLVFSLFYLLSFGQVGFPVKNYTTKQQNAYDHLGVHFEGLRFTTPSGFIWNGSQSPAVNGTIVTGSDQSLIGGVNVPLTCAMYVTTLHGWTSAPVRINFSIGPGNAGPREVYSGRFELSPNKVVFGGQAITGLMQGIPAPIASENRVLVDASAQAIKFSNDFDFEAPYRMLVTGDSNYAFDACEGATHKEQAAHWLLKEWFATRNDTLLGGKRRVQIIDKTYGGKTSGYGEALRNGGGYDVDDPSLILWGFGTNDIDTTTYKTNITRLIRWKKYRYPNAKLIVLGPGPRTGAGEAIAVNMRTAGANAVAASPDANTYFCNLGTAFSNANDANFTTNDATSSTSRVHWNVAGHQKIFERIRDFMISQNIRFGLNWALLLFIPAMRRKNPFAARRNDDLNQAA